MEHQVDLHEGWKNSHGMLALQDFSPAFFVRVYICILVYSICIKKILLECNF